VKTAVLLTVPRVTCGEVDLPRFDMRPRRAASPAVSTNSALCASAMVLSASAARTRFTASEATAFHEEMEGYGEGDADAEFVCVLPDAVQSQAEREQGGWPSDDLLVACGAEFIPHTPPDGLAELRAQLGSGGRVVRIEGRVYSEGDVVGNTRHRLGATPDA
jgi:hypothetical protein